MNDSNTVFTATKMSQVRQGDVLITPALKPISNADIGDLIKDGDGKRVVLAYGEVTGHAHAFYPHLDVAENEFSSPALKEGLGKKQKFASSVVPNKEPAVSLYKLRNAQQYSGSNLPADNQRLLRLRERSLLRHEEHSTISLPPGDYVVIQQNEGDELGELRRVAD